MAGTPRKEGFGKTLKDAFEDYGRQKGIEKLDQRRSLTLDEALAEFEGEWLDVEISVQLQPHNQWVKTFRVRDK